MTKLQNQTRGHQRVHTVACYQDTWHKFNSFKHNKGMTADEVMNLLVDSYEKSDDVKQHQYLINLRDNLQSKIDKIELEME